MVLKRLLDQTEELTNDILRPLAEKWNAHTFPKVRLADCFRIKNSGISDELYSFAMKSHFDFVVADSEPWPLFAVEFDGESHSSPEQQRRDRLKDQLCERFELPLLRINSRYLDPKYRQMDVLSWFVNYWFAQRMIDDAYESGAIPPDAFVDPMLMTGLPGDDSSRMFPLWLSANVRQKFHRHRELGHCLDPGPSSFVGTTRDGAQRAIAYMAVTQKRGIFAETAMRAQMFPVPCEEILDAILEHEVYSQFEDVLQGKREAVPLEAICSRLDWYRANCEMMCSGVGTQSTILRAAAPISESLRQILRRPSQERPGEV